MIKLKPLIEIESDKKIYVLIGPPAVGKSTWIKNTFSSEPYIISRDDIVDQVASENGWSYDEMFSLPPPNAQVGEEHEKFGKVIPAPIYMPWTKTAWSRVVGANGKVQALFQKRVSGATIDGRDIVVDMTNMTRKARNEALKAIKGFEDKYEKIAVVFNFRGGEDIIKKMSQKRAKVAREMGKPKTIPDHVYDKMFASYQDVSSDEKFDNVINVDTLDSIKKNLQS